MAIYTFRLPSDLLAQARKKARLIPLGVVVRSLVILWLKGKIDLDDYSAEDLEIDERG